MTALEGGDGDDRGRAWHKGGGLGSAARRGGSSAS